MAKNKRKYEATKIRIPTASKYAFIELTVGGTAEEVVAAYYEVSEVYWKESKARAKKAGKKIIKTNT